MINKRYPQEEERMYITDSKYLLVRSRYGYAGDCNMSADDFARNIWLIEGDDIIWRVHSDIDEEGEPFRYLWLTYSEYLAVRQDKNEKNDNNTWILDMASGKAELYPKTKDRFAGDDLQLYIKRETRIYFDDESYILLVLFPRNNHPRNVSRISATGEELWKISFRADLDDTPSYIYEYLRLLEDGTIIAFMDERFQFAIDIETGKATPGSFL